MQNLKFKMANVGNLIGLFQTMKMPVVAIPNSLNVLGKKFVASSDNHGKKGESKHDTLR
ncbi:MAG: hypothetical protein SGJ00_00080 [bacterium]|nr:hypothetical protein [bacterium]